jgi:hypothetical protein
MDSKPCLRSLIGAGLLGAALGPVFLVLLLLGFGNLKGGSVKVEGLLAVVITCAAYTTSVAGLAVWLAVRSRLRRVGRWVMGLLFTGPVYGAAVLHAWFPDSGSAGLVLGVGFGVLFAFFGGLAVLSVADVAASGHTKQGGADGTMKNESSDDPSRTRHVT